MILGLINLSTLISFLNPDEYKHKLTKAYARPINHHFEIIVAFNIHFPFDSVAITCFPEFSSGPN